MLTVADVAEGLCATLSHMPGHALQIDCGSRAGGRLAEAAWARILRGRVWPISTEPEAFILTHIHTDPLLSKLAGIQPVDLEVLLERLEEQLDLPPVLVDGDDRGGPEGQVVGQEDQGAVLVGVVLRRVPLPPRPSRLRSDLTRSPAASAKRQ